MGVGGRTKGVRGIREETCWDEHWVLYISDESQNSIPEIIVALYNNELECKFKKNKLKTAKNVK